MPTFTARAVLLDMDGTLVDSTVVVESLWRAWAREHDVDEDRTLAVVHGRQGQESMAILLPERDRAINDLENAAMLQQESSRTDGIVAVPGASALLDALRDVPHALVTSADLRLATVRMETAGLPMPPVRVTAEDVTRSKPHPEPFLRAAGLVGNAPEHCLVFEDAEAGITAALAAGMSVIGVGPRAGGCGASALVADLAGVRVRAVPDGIEVTVP